MILRKIFCLYSTLWDGGPGKTSSSTSRGGGNRKCCGAKFSKISIILRKIFFNLHLMGRRTHKTSSSTSRGKGNRKCCGSKLYKNSIILRRNFLLYHIMWWRWVQNTLIYPRRWRISQVLRREIQQKLNNFAEIFSFPLPYGVEELLKQAAPPHVVK